MIALKEFSCLEELLTGVPAEKSVKRLRRILWNKWPKCHWCGRVTVLESKRNKWGNITQHPHTATVDHMKSRLAGRRPHEFTAKVIACYYCNTSRAALEHFELTRRGRAPKHWYPLFRSGMDGDGI